MSPRLKAALDLVGILISLASLGVLFADERYLASGLLFCLLLALIGYGIKLLLAEPYRVISVEYSYSFLDGDSRSVDISKKTILVPKERNVTTLEDLGIGAEGEIEAISTNNGMCIIRKHGGSTSVSTHFDTELDRNSEYVHVLSYRGINCFPDSNESVIHTTHRKMDEARINLRFNPSKRPSNVKAIIRVGNRSTDITGKHLAVSNLDYMFSYRNPRKGSIFEIRWEW